MFNLLGNYVSEIPIAYWENLFDAIQENEAILRINIQQEESTMKKERADIALNLLLPALQNWIHKKKLKTAQEVKSPEYMSELMGRATSNIPAAKIETEVITFIGKK